MLPGGKLSDLLGGRVVKATKSEPNFRCRSLGKFRLSTPGENCSMMAPENCTLLLR
jgi:hypothetical protein